MTFEEHWEAELKLRFKLLVAAEHLLLRYDPEDTGAAMEPSSHCPECTHNTTPDTFGRWPCPMHELEAAVKACHERDKTLSKKADAIKAELKEEQEAAQ